MSDRCGVAPASDVLSAHVAPEYVPTMVPESLPTMRRNTHNKLQTSELTNVGTVV